MRVNIYILPLTILSSFDFSLYVVNVVYSKKYNDCYLFRPKLPQKLRTGKQWNDDSGCPASPARSRVSAGSSISATSLNEIDELDESLEDVSSQTLKIDQSRSARTPSPEVKVIN